MIKITSAVKALLSNGYFISDREISSHPIMNGNYKQN